MKRAAAAVLALGLLTGSALPASAGTGDELRPDLIVRRPSDLDVRITGSGRHRLRFTTTTANLGIGPVELEPVKDDCDGDGDIENDRTAVQRTYLDEDGNEVFDPAIDVDTVQATVGCFFFHARHGHWHFADFAGYRLVNPRTGRVVARQAKLGFCVVDNHRWRPDVPGSPSDAFYRSCAPDAVQGLSPGWADVYSAFLAAQWLDVTGLAAGRYCLVQRIDPGGKIAEADETDNVNRTPIRLGASSASRRSGEC